MLDAPQWHEFRVGDILPNIVKPPVLHVRQIEETKGGIPYVVRSKFNNGIKYRVIVHADVAPNPAGVITFGAENATFFYQTEPFVSGRDIYYIDTRWLDASACLFLATCLQRVAEGYTYNNGLFPDLLKQETIKLPCDAEGEPDWDYMSHYMSACTDDASRVLVAFMHVNMNSRVLPTGAWRHYAIGGPNGLFRIEKGTRLTRANMLEGDIPFIGASTDNNGITAYIGNTEHLHPGNVITVAYNGQKATGKAFYQPGTFWASDDVHVLYPKFELNELHALFLLPIFRIMGEPYAFEDKWKIEYMEKDSLVLPASSDGAPDWDYMEDYMRSLVTSQRENLAALS